MSKGSGRNHNGELGSEYMSDFDPDTIKPELLAEELGVLEYRLPDEQYQHAEMVIQDLTNTIVPKMKGLPKEAVGDFLLEHQAEVMAMFDRFPDMWRFPLLLRADSFIAHTLSASLLEMEPSAYFGCILRCMHFYLYVQAVRGLARLYKKYPTVLPAIPMVEQIVQDECRNEIEAAWWARSKHYFYDLFPGEKGDAIVQNIVANCQMYHIPPSMRPQYKQRKIDYWKQPGLPPERMLLKIATLTQLQGKDADGLAHACAVLDVEALNFFLCQTHICGYEELVCRAFVKEDYLPTWKEWILRYFHLLKQKDSQMYGIFCHIFKLKWEIFTSQPGGHLTREAKEKIPEVLHSALLEADVAYRKKIKEERAKKPKTIVQNIPIPPPAQSSMAHLASPRLPEVPLVTLESPNLDCSVDVQTGIVRTGAEWKIPEGCTVSYEASYIQKGKPKIIDSQTWIDMAQGTLSPEYGGIFNKTITIRITVEAPVGSTFATWKTVSWPLAFYRRDPELSRPIPVALPASEGEKDAVKKETTVPVEPPTQKAKTLEDTIAAWAIALSEPASLQSSQDGQAAITLTLTDSDLLQELHDPAYRKIMIASDDTIAGGSFLDEVETRRLLDFAQGIRRESARIQEEQQEQEIYQQLSQELRPSLECLQRLAGTEWLTEQTAGWSLNRAFADPESGVPLRAEVDRYDKARPGSKNVFDLHFQGRDVIARYMPTIGVKFTGPGYEGMSLGVQRAYEDFSEVLEHLGDFLFLTQERKAIRLRNMKEHRAGIVAAFMKNLSQGKAELIVLRDTQIVPSFLWDRTAHALFPTESCPPPMYISSINEKNLRARYDDTRKKLGGKNGDLSVVCLVRKGYLQMSGDTKRKEKDAEREGENTDKPERDGDQKESTIERNIRSLARSPQGRDLLWDRIYATKGGGTGTPIYNGPLEVLNSLLFKKYGDVLPTQEREKQIFIDEYLHELQKANILLSYVRFSAVTMREVESARSVTAG